MAKSRITGIICNPGPERKTTVHGGTWNERHNAQAMANLYDTNFNAAGTTSFGPWPMCCTYLCSCFFITFIIIFFIMLVSCFTSSTSENTWYFSYS